MMRFKLWTIAVLMLAAGSAMAGSYDIKGIELNHRYSNAQIIAKFGHDRGGYGDIKFGNSIDCITGTSCSGETIIGTSTWHVLISRTHDGTVGDMSGYFSASGFLEIDGLMRKKFGAPTEVAHQDMRNAFGAVFNNTIELWRSESGDVITLYHYIDAESGTLKVQSAKYLAEDAAYRKKSSCQGQYLSAPLHPTATG
jgi:hypothetical protein